MLKVYKELRVFKVYLDLLLELEHKELKELKEQ